MTARLALTAAVAVAAGMLVGTVAAFAEDGPGVTDVPVYIAYGEAITGGDVPYQDFSVEYPPGALVPFVVPALVTSGDGAYDRVFRSTMALALGMLSALVVVALAALRAPLERVWLALGALWLGVLLLGPFAFTRFDLYAATLTVAATAAVLHRRRTLGPVLLGLAIATKIYPAVLLPLLASRAARQGGRREAVRALTAAVGTAVLVYLPFLAVAPGGVAHSIWRQLGRPLQIESLGASVLLALHHALGMPLGWASGSGSQNLTGAVASVASGVTTVAGVAALLLVWIRFHRGDAASEERFARYAAGAIVAFVAFGKVLSPQFLVWLLAAVVLVQGRRGIVAIALLTTACALTRAWFPRSYWELVKEFDATSSWLVLARDLVLVAVFAALVLRIRATATERAASSATWRGRSPDRTPRALPRS